MTETWTRLKDCGKKKKKARKLASLSQYIPRLVHVLTVSLWFSPLKESVDEEHVVDVHFYTYLYSVSLSPEYVKQQHCHFGKETEIRFPVPPRPPDLRLGSQSLDSF